MAKYTPKELKELAEAMARYERAHSFKPLPSNVIQLRPRAKTTPAVSKPVPDSKSRVHAHHSSKMKRASS